MAETFSNILAFDTSVNGCSVAVAAGETRAVRIRPMERGHAEHLIPMIEETMRECGLSYGGLDAIAVTVGPGAFTGIRIGLSAAQALGLSLSVPVYGISTAQVLALDCARKTGRGGVVAIDTRRGDFYAGRFDGRGDFSGAVRVVSAADLAALAAALAEGEVLIGDGAALAGDAGIGSRQGFEFPDVSLIVSFLKEDEMRDAYFILDPSPIYLREADVSLPSSKNRVLAEK